MRKLLPLLAASLLPFAAAGAQGLRFRPDGTFKIVQVTDVHYNGSRESRDALSVIDSVLAAERPDLVVLTGDVIWGRPARENLLAVLRRVARHGAPFALQFGNHDFEQGLTNRELYDIARGVAPNVLPDLAGAPELDYVLRVAPSRGEGAAAALYLLDTHAYAKGFPDDKSHGTYAWLTHRQVEWFWEASARQTAAHGGSPMPSLAFLHIPLPEYGEAARSEGATLVGTRGEASCAPLLNTGMFAAMVESGDVLGVFCGHDHDNDYAVSWHGLLLAYGRYSGGNTVYNHLRHGARVIVLREGERRFETWIREFDGTICHKTTFPDSYVF